MNWQTYTELMQDIRELSKDGWVYIFAINSNGDSRTMSHKKHGIHTFDTWLKLKIFVEKELNR